MNLKTDENKTIALAALFQACSLVKEIAKSGKEFNQSVQTSIHSIFKLDSASVEDIYGGLPGLIKGFQALNLQLDQANKQSKEIDVIRYVFALLYLERRLVKMPDMLDKLTVGINNARQQANYFGSETHENVIANLADLYQQTISTLNPKIMVHGEPPVLSNPENANLIRALLLAGMRATILWRQCGGSRWQLLFGRGKIIKNCKNLLNRALSEDIG